MINRPKKPTQFKIPAKQTEVADLDHPAAPISLMPDNVKSHCVKINTVWQKVVSSIIETGKLLIEAKEALEHGEFSKMFDDGGLPFGLRTAQCLMKIAEHPIISDPKHASLLPPYWATLNTLTRLPELAFKEMLENGQINSETERQEAEKLIAYVNKEGLHKYERVAESLRVLMEFMDEWPEPKKLPPAVFDEIGKISDTKFKKVSEWVDDLYAVHMMSLQSMEATFATVGEGTPAAVADGVTNGKKKSGKAQEPNLWRTAEKSRKERVRLPASPSAARGAEAG